MRSAYQATLVAWIAKHQRYPRRARRQGLEGVVKVMFRLDAQGVVTETSIRRSSGHPALDNAALNMLEQASPMPSPPPGYPEDGRVFTIPVEFRLR